MLYLAGQPFSWRNNATHCHKASYGLVMQLGKDPLFKLFCVYLLPRVRSDSLEHTFRASDGNNQQLMKAKLWLALNRPETFQRMPIHSCSHTLKKWWKSDAEEHLMHGDYLEDGVYGSTLKLKKARPTNQC